MVCDAKHYSNAKIFITPRAFTTEFYGVLINNPLVALDQDGQLIPHTYLGQVATLSFSNIAESCPAEQALKSGFLFYSNPWSGNFQHFLTELFPKVLDYFSLAGESGSREIPLLIPKAIYNKFTAELLEFLSIADHITILESGVVYRVENLYSSSYIPNFHEVHKKLLAAYRIFHDRFLNKHKQAGQISGRRLYLARDTSADNSRNNNNAGSQRIIVNEDELFAVLQRNGFTSTALGGCSIAEKAAELAGCDIIVSPIGANLLNLLFLSPPYPEILAIIYSTTFNQHRYFIDIFSQLYQGAISFYAFAGKAHGEDVNSPYEVNIQDFTKELSEWLKQLNRPA